MSWSLTTHEPALPSPESHLEQSFRKVFTERVTALGATVKETPGPKGNRLSITFPGATRQWTLEPQVQMGGSRPDFVLRSSQGSLPAVAIFTDGWLYHASPAHNRIADDARKRQELRDGGAIVLGITARDVEQARNGTFEAPAWLNERRDRDADELERHLPAAERGGHQARPDRLPALLDPEPGRRRAPGARQPAAASCSPRRPAQFAMDPTADLAGEAALRLLDPDRVTPAGDHAASPGGGAPDGRLPRPGRRART